MRFRPIIALALLTSAASAKVSFNNDIRPLLSNTCYRCHGPDEADRKAGLRLDTHAGATADNDGVKAIVPGDLGASELVYRIISDDPDEVMPPPDAGKKFTPEQIAILKQWIEEGANYETHWSYQQPTRPVVPKVEGNTSPNPIDAFVARRHAEKGVTFADEAEPEVLARRAALDLTGLPPTLEELEVYLSDQSEDRFEKYVDRLLAKPAYGEHWARMWLDLARYADSAGYADDSMRTIWAYRDWVIRAFNENKPFDAFTIEQLAGDLLPNATDDQIVATGFNRNTQTNSEGGTDDEEFRNVAVVDRVNTTMSTWMGTTMACAQCHTHKYDPITHTDYFSMFAIFNQTEDTDKKDERPTLPVFSPQQQSKRAELEQQIAKVESELTAPNAANLAALAAWEAGLAEDDSKWQPIEIVIAEATSGATFTKLDDGSLKVSGKMGETDKYTIDASTALKTINAVKIEALTDPDFDTNGPGRKGNFVLNEFEITTNASGDTQPGRFVRIELPGKSKLLHLAEVQVFAGGKNVAVSGTAKQSSTYNNADAQRANDGNTNGDYNQGSVAHTGTKDKSPFWEVDLGAAKDIERVVVWNRTDGATRERLDGFKLIVLDEKRLPLLEKTIAKAPEKELAISIDGGQSAIFAGATSTFDQNRFTVADSIDGNDNSHSGWAVGPENGKDHYAIYELKRPLPAADLRFVLRQTYGNLPLGKFRISVRQSDAPQRALPHRLARVIAVPSDQRTPGQTAALLDHFSQIHPVAIAARDQLADLRKQIAAIKPHTTVPVMRDLDPKKHRETYIHLRGSHLAKGPVVTAALPSAFPKPKIDGAVDRLALAKWLVGGENPLTARVSANRFWEKLFGIGIVATSEEFGSQGELPSHPELLDWMAVEFVESGWDMKALLKRIATSRTYRQKSEASDQMLTDDPENRLLARGPRFRLSAEMVRDQALLAAGLLSEKMYGEPVRPPQPDLGLKAAFGSKTDWQTSEGEDKYRRGLYTTWRRSSPYPSMAAFDAPNREVCVVRRDRTNTPLQALVTLNDPVYVEAAQALARKMHTAAKEGKSAAAGIEHGFQTCVARPPKPVETERLVALFKESLAHYKGDEAMAAKMATDPIGAAPEGADVAELAALTLVGNVLLNLDEALMKR